MVNTVKLNLKGTVFEFRKMTDDDYSDFVQDGARLGMPRAIANTLRRLCTDSKAFGLWSKAKTDGKPNAGVFALAKFQLNFHVFTGTMIKDGDSYDSRYKATFDKDSRRVTLSDSVTGDAVEVVFKEGDEENVFEYLRKKESNFFVALKETANDLLDKDSVQPFNEFIKQHYPAIMHIVFINAVENMLGIDEEGVDDFFTVTDVASHPKNDTSTPLSRVQKTT